jgi:hypothetical protein
MVKLGSQIVKNQDQIRASKKVLKKVIFFAKKCPNPQNPQGLKSTKKMKKSFQTLSLFFEDPFYRFY